MASCVGEASGKMCGTSTAARYKYVKLNARARKLLPPFSLFGGALGRFGYPAGLKRPRHRERVWGPNRVCEYGIVVVVFVLLKNLKFSFPLELVQLQSHSAIPDFPLPDVLLPQMKFPEF